MTREKTVTLKMSPAKAIMLLTGRLVRHNSAIFFERDDIVEMSPELAKLAEFLDEHDAGHLANEMFMDLAGVAEEMFEGVKFQALCNVPKSMMPPKMVSAEDMDAEREAFTMKSLVKEMRRRHRMPWKPDGP